MEEANTMLIERIEGILIKVYYFEWVKLTIHLTISIRN